VLDQIRLAKKARACFARAVELDPDGVPALSDLARYDMRAPSVLGGGRRKARALVERVQTLAPVRGHVLAGELADLEKDSARAESEFRAAIAADPRSEEGWAALSGLFVARRRFADARAVWDGAAEKGGGAALSAYGLAGVALASGEELSDAARRLREVLERRAWSGAPEPAECHERLGALYAELGRRHDAAAELEAAVRLEPGRSDWRLRLARLSAGAP
jgi:tetratricopeptide (TPR) repeat protein